MRVTTVSSWSGVNICRSPFCSISHLPQASRPTNPPLFPLIMHDPEVSRIDERLLLQSLPEWIPPNEEHIKGHRGSAPPGHLHGCRSAPSASAPGRPPASHHAADQRQMTGEPRARQSCWVPTGERSRSKQRAGACAPKEPSWKEPQPTCLHQ